MKIQFDQLSQTDAFVKIEIAPEDYMDAFRKEVKTYSKKIALKGFRAHSRLYLESIQKRYGKEILMSTILPSAEKLLHEQIEKHQLTIVGTIRPDMEIWNEQQWQPGNRFTFAYKLDTVADGGFDPNIEEDIEVRKYQITSVSPKTLKQAISKLQKIYGKVQTQDANHAIVLNDIVFGDLIDAKEAKHPLQVYLDENNLASTKLEGCKVGQEVTWEIKNIQALQNDIPKDIWEKITQAKQKVRFVIKEVKKTLPAPLNAIFFAQVLGKGKASTVEAFHKAFKQTYLAYKQSLINHFTKQNIQQQVAQKYPITIGKKYASQRGKITWDLFLQKIAKKHNLQVTQPEIGIALFGFYKNIFQHLDKATQEKSIVKEVQHAFANPQGEVYLHGRQMVLENKIHAIIEEKAKQHTKKIQAEEVNSYLSSIPNG